MALVALVALVVVMVGSVDSVDSVDSVGSVGSVDGGDGTHEWKQRSASNRGKGRAPYLLLRATAPPVMNYRDRLG